MRTIGWLPQKKGKSKLPLFCGNGERVNFIYGRRYIGNAGGTSQDMTHRSHTGRRPYKDQVISGCKYDTPAVPGGLPDSGTGMNYHDPHTKGAGIIQRQWSGGGDLENDHLHHKHLHKGDRLPEWRPAWVTAGKREGHIRTVVQDIPEAGVHLSWTFIPSVTLCEEVTQLVG